MKKILFAIFVMVCFSILLVSCNSKPAPQSLVEQQVTVTEPHFFYLVESLIEKGNTVWGRAKIYLGDGNRWREIIAKNKFMQEPGRVWKDSVTCTWYALIRPGEKLIIDSQEVNPVFVDIVDAPVQQNIQQPADTFKINPTAIWLWVWIIAGFLIIVSLLFWLFRRNQHDQYIHVDINHAGNINLATYATLTEHRQELQNRSLAIVERGAEKGTLESFSVYEDPDSFEMSASFFKNSPATPANAEPGMKQPE